MPGDTKNIYLPERKITRNIPKFVVQKWVRPIKTASMMENRRNLMVYKANFAKNVFEILGPSIFQINVGDNLGDEFIM